MKDFKQMILLMDKFHVDSYGRPVGRLNGKTLMDTGEKYIIIPQDKLPDRIYNNTYLIPTLWCVAKFTNIGLQQVSPWYHRYGNAVRYLTNI